MQILLLRHGEAADAALGSGSADEERALTRQGRDSLRTACRCYDELVAPPERILSSPLLRARQTAEILAEACDVAADHIETTDALVPAARPTLVLDRIQGEALVGARCIAVVGHEPHLGSLLGLLLTGAEHQALPLRKGMLVRVDLEAPQTLLGRLRLCLSPEDCAALGA